MEQGLLSNKGRARADTPEGSASQPCIAGIASPTSDGWQAKAHGCFSFVKKRHALVICAGQPELPQSQYLHLIRPLGDQVPQFCGVAAVCSLRASRSHRIERRGECCGNRHLLSVMALRVSCKRIAGRSEWQDVVETFIDIVYEPLLPLFWGPPLGRTLDHILCSCDMPHSTVPRLECLIDRAL